MSLRVDMLTPAAHLARLRRREFYTVEILHLFDASGERSGAASGCFSPVSGARESPPIIEDDPKVLSRHAAQSRNGSCCSGAVARAQECIKPGAPRRRVRALDVLRRPRACLSE